MNVSIRAKLLTFSVLAFGIAAGIGFLADRDIGRLHDSINDIAPVATLIRNHMEADMMHDALRGDVLSSLGAKTPEEVQVVTHDTQEHAHNFRDSLEKNLRMKLSSELRAAITNTMPDLERYIASAEKFVANAVKDPAATKESLPEFQRFFGILESKMSTLSDLIEGQAAQTTLAAQATTVKAQRETIIALSVGLALCFSGAIALVRAVCNPIKTLNRCIQDIANGEGDLTQRVDETRGDELGELGKWFNLFVSKIERVIIDVKAGAAQIDAGGTQIASASQSLAQGASEQASSLQQISASVEQMSGQTKQSAENARQASTLAEESKKSADRGQQEMAQMNKAVSEIKQSSSEISKIIKVIDEIAFQTNLLALNAAVEAARAGEAGKGFAVVAEEVRNLAQRSAEAAKSTSAMIEESVKRSENGVQIAGRVGTALEEITSATNKVNALLSEIAAASGEQATGIGQVNQGVSQLDQVTQQNAGNSEELASSAEELSSQVISLNELVSQFKVAESPIFSAAPIATRETHAPVTKSTAVAKIPAAAHASVPSKTAAQPTPAEIAIPLESDETLASF